jgi:hypothetical protein
MNNATEYINSIVATLENIQEIHSMWWKDNVPTTVDRLREAASTDPDDHARFDALAEFLEREFPDDADDLGISYLESSLETWVNVRWKWDEVGVREARALITTGGPHVEIFYDGVWDDVVTVEVFWWGEEGRRNVQCAPVAYALNVLIENAELSLK